MRTLSTPTPLAIRLPNHVGDACMTLPAIRLAEEAGCAPTLVGRAWGASLFEAHGWPYVAIGGRLAEDVPALRAALHGLTPRARCGITFPKSFSSALLFRLAGLRTAGHAIRGRGWLLDAAAPGAGEGHEVERFFGLVRFALERWGHPVQRTAPGPTLGLRLAGHHHASARRVLDSCGVASRFALLAPIATGLHHGRIKQWPEFGALVAPLKLRGLVCVAAPPPAEAEATRAVLPDAVMLPSVDLGTLAALAAMATLVIANDSGVSHIAAAVAAPQVTIFGATDIDRTRPWSPRAQIVGAPSCWPSMDAVLQAVDRALAIADEPIGV
jgi:heptosyltransferase-2